MSRIVNHPYRIYFAGNRSNAGCAPGWYKANQACFLFLFQQISYFAKWSDARSLCHRLGADLAVVKNAKTLRDLANKRRQIKSDDYDFFLGLSSQPNWVWSDGTDVSTTFNLWGPGEPSGGGKCGSFNNGISWNSTWKGYGWRWSNKKCSDRQGYICEKPLGGLYLLAILLHAGNETRLILVKLIGISHSMFLYQYWPCKQI